MPALLKQATAQSEVVRRSSSVVEKWSLPRYLNCRTATQHVAGQVGISKHKSSAGWKQTLAVREAPRAVYQANISSAEGSV